MTPIEPLGARIDAVVMGASAGGIEALSALLPQLPAGAKAAVFVVVHLPPERPSLLVQIFRSKCRLPVREAEDKAPVEPGTVYFAPPDYHLLLDKGPALALSADELVHYSRPSIDVLFESAADVYAKRLLGIILTGANDDGASGLQAVQRAGGMIVVQRPQTAQASVMPASALQTSPRAGVLSLAQIGYLLSTLGVSDAK